MPHLMKDMELLALVGEEYFCCTVVGGVDHWNCVKACAYAGHLCCDIDSETGMNHSAVMTNQIWVQ